MTEITPRIETLAEKKLVGAKIRMSLKNNMTAQVFQAFMPLRNTIVNRVDTNLISMRVYSGPFHPGDLEQEFDKWAAAEVDTLNMVPPGMETTTIPAGLYAVFHYKGLNTDSSIYRYIYSTWLPSSGYCLDERPHFETLSRKYKNNDPESEEEIWIPVVLK
jgi:AraC family transcriptional regulator